MTVKLKPCLFCGGEAASFSMDDSCNYRGENVYRAVAACRECSAGFELFHLGDGMHCDALEEKAAALWNRRADESESRMKPMNDERRDVASELRKLADCYKKTPAWSVLVCGELPAPLDDALMVCGVRGAAYATEICERLADLIEPTERTCVVEHRSGGVFHLSCGHDSTEHVKPDYCPTCGRRVVE